MYSNIDFNNQLIVTVGFQVKTQFYIIVHWNIWTFKDDFIQFSDILSTRAQELLILCH